MAREVHGQTHIGAWFNKLERKAHLMNITSITPSIGVTIGRLTRLYYAYITTAPAALDAPATLTLYTAPITDVCELAYDEIAFDRCRARTPARLILVDTTERTCREHRHLLAEADPVLVGLNKLQDWLWQRLGALPTDTRTEVGHASIHTPQSGLFEENDDDDDDQDHPQRTQQPAGQAR
jgi:hypothetical protein